MRILEHSYQILVLLCVCPPDKDPTNKWIQRRNAILSLLTIVLIMVPNVASIVFMVQYFRIDLASAFCACYQAAALTKCIYTLFVAYIIRDDVKKAFDALQTFYDSSKNPLKSKSPLKSPIFFSSLICWQLKIWNYHDLWTRQISAVHGLLNLPSKFSLSPFRTSFSHSQFLPP